MGESGASSAFFEKVASFDFICHWIWLKLCATFIIIKYVTFEFVQQWDSYGKNGCG